MTMCLWPIVVKLTPISGACDELKARKTKCSERTISEEEKTIVASGYNPTLK